MNTRERGLDPLLMGMHLVTALLVVASCARAIMAQFRVDRTFANTPLTIMGVEFVLMFSWALYYGSHSVTLRRALRALLWTHVAVSPVLVWLLR